MARFLLLYFVGDLRVTGLAVLGEPFLLFGIYNLIEDDQRHRNETLDVLIFVVEFSLLMKLCYGSLSPPLDAKMRC